MSDYYLMSCNSESLIFAFVSLLLVAFFSFSLFYEITSLYTPILLIYFIAAPVVLDLLFTLVGVFRIRADK